MKRTSRELCNMSRRRGQICGGVGGETALVHFNGVYIKAQQINSWVLDVRGSEKPFRYTTVSLLVQIDGRSRHSALCEGRRSAAMEPCRHYSSFYEVNV